MQVLQERPLAFRMTCNRNGTEVLVQHPARGSGQQLLLRLLVSFEAVEEGAQIVQRHYFGLSYTTWYAARDCVQKRQIWLERLNAA